MHIFACTFAGRASVNCTHEFRATKYTDGNDGHDGRRSFPRKCSRNCHVASTVPWNKRPWNTRNSRDRSFVTIYIRDANLKNPLCDNESGAQPYTLCLGKHTHAGIYRVERKVRSILHLQKDLPQNWPWISKSNFVLHYILLITEVKLIVLLKNGQKFLNHLTLRRTRPNSDFMVLYFT